MTQLIELIHVMELKGHSPDLSSLEEGSMKFGYSTGFVFFVAVTMFFAAAIFFAYLPDS